MFDVWIKLLINSFLLCLLYGKSTTIRNIDRILGTYPSGISYV